MAKISANYEVVYIIDPAQGEEAVAATVAKFKTLAEQHGVRRRAWTSGASAVWPIAINYMTEGYYVLMTFTSAPRVPQGAGPYPSALPTALCVP